MLERPQRVLVTGAAGFIGSHTVEELVRRDCVVLGVDNLRTGKLTNLSALRSNSTFSFEEVDIVGDESLFKLVNKFKPQAVVHLAALVSVTESIEDPELNFRLNIWATHSVAEAARRCGVPRIVFASSAAVYGNSMDLPLRENAELNPVSPYGTAKLASENILLGYSRSYGLNVRCHRYFNVYGPRQDPTSPYSGVVSIFLKRFKEGRSAVVFGNGEQTRDFIYVSDVARANVRAALGDCVRSGVANICTGTRVSLNELVEMFNRHFPSAPPVQYSKARSGDIVHSFGYSLTAETELAFRATIRFEEGLAYLIEYEAF